MSQVKKERTSESRTHKETEQMISVLFCSDGRNGLVQLEEEGKENQMASSKSYDFILRREEARVHHIPQASSL